ncbi:hypothetical protein H632_c5305p0, partial [Helicosporidium sp. ATCC 50920]
ARRQAAQGSAPLGPAGDGQDAPGARRGGRGGRALFLPLRERVRRDARRRRRLPSPSSVRDRQGPRPLHHLHRRARCRGRASHAGPDGKLAHDAEPAADGDGRLRAALGRRGPRGDKHPRSLGSGSAPPGPVRPAGGRAAARRG